jgi:hypothetical protein
MMDKDPEQSERRIRKRHAPVACATAPQTPKRAFGDGHNTSDAEIRLWTYFPSTTA